MLRKLHKAPTGGSLSGKTLRPSLWPPAWSQNRYTWNVCRNRPCSDTSWLVSLSLMLLVFLPLACKSFSGRVSVTSLRFNAAGIVKQKLSCTLLKLGCILWWVIVHCWDSQVPCVCPVPWEPPGAGTVYQGLSGSGLALSSAGNLILMTWPGAEAGYNLLHL